MQTKIFFSFVLSFLFFGVLTIKSQPLAPTNLTASVERVGLIRLSWIDNSNDETGFVIERSGIDLAYSTLTITSANVTTFDDITVQESKEYNYRVYAYKYISPVIANSNSGYSNVINITSLTIIVNAWSLQNSSPIWSPIIRRIIFTNQDVGWAIGSTNACLKTTNGGNTWIQQTVSNTSLSFRDGFFINENIGWLIGSSLSGNGNRLILKTSDGGNNWVTLFENNAILSMLNIFFINQDKGWISTSDGVLRTTDGGINWVNSSISGGSLFRSVFFTDEFNGISVNGTSIYKSTDGGISWNRVFVDNNYNLRKVFFISKKIGFIVGAYFTMGCILKTEDGGNSWKLVSPIVNVELIDIHFADNDNGYIVGNAGTILKTIDMGNTWSQLQQVTAQDLFAVNFLSPNLGYIGGNYGLIYKTSSGGAAPINSPNNLTASYDGANIILNWIDNSNNEQGFAIERKLANENDFKQIAVVGANTTNYYDNVTNITSTCYYRVKAYNSNIFSGYSNIVSINSPYKNFTISVNSNPSNGGSTSGGGLYSFGESVTLYAYSNSGSEFVNWTENNLIISTNPSYTFTVNSNRQITANFKISNYVVNVYASPQNAGNVSGGGNYTSGQTATIHATPFEGYRFYYWTENSSVVSTDKDYSFTVTSNRYFVANFDVLQYYILVNISPSNGGTVNGSGRYRHNQTVNLVATPSNGYVFINWTEGNNIVSMNQTYQFVATSNRNITANFGIRQQVTTISNPTNSGILTGSGTYEQGEKVIVTATPTLGYYFLYWTENNSIISTVTSYEFTIESSRNLVANFIPAYFSLVLSAYPVQGGVISGGGVFNYNQSSSISAIPNTGFSFLNWVENGQVVSTQSNYNLQICSNRNLTAVFNGIPLFTDVMPDQTIQVHNVPVKFSYQYKGNDPDNEPVTFSLSPIGRPDGSELTSSGLFTWIPKHEQAGNQYQINVSITDGKSTVSKVTILKVGNSITDVNDNVKPTVIILFQNYPNPFNPTTKIQFSLPKEEFVRLSVFNPLGQEVKVLVNETLPPTTYSFDFDGSELTNGIYLYRLQASDFTQTKKMILMK